MKDSWRERKKQKKKQKFWTEKEKKNQLTHTPSELVMFHHLSSRFFCPPGLHFFLQHVKLKWTKSGDWCQGTKIKKGAIFSHSADILQSLVWFKNSKQSSLLPTPKPQLCPIHLDWCLVDLYYPEYLFPWGAITLVSLILSLNKGN